MRLTKQRLALLGAAGMALVAGVFAALGWWQAALVVMALLQGAAVAVLFDLRGRMARASDVRKVSSAIKATQRRLDNIGTRMISAAETSRVETSDRLAAMAQELAASGRDLAELKTSGTAQQKELAELAAVVDAYQTRFAEWDTVFGRLGQDVESVRGEAITTREHVAQALDAAEKDRVRLDKRQNAATAGYVRQTEALIQLYDRIQPRASMPSAGGWALDPTGLLTLLEIVERRRPALVVELGSGTSTLWLGYALQRLGAGRLVAVDHDEHYAQKTRTNVTAHGLDDVIEVRVAPLADAGLADHDAQWYDHAALADLKDVDLLVVDGPPQATGPMARYPAVPKLIEQLSASAVVALDDARRQDEREVLQRWSDEFGLAQWPVPPGDALVVLARG